jgi:hypothetical protein
LAPEANALSTELQGQEEINFTTDTVATIGCMRVLENKTGFTLIAKNNHLRRQVRGGPTPATPGMNVLSGGK